jgi:putative methyltransferase
VNLLNTTLDDAIAAFADEGWQWVGELSVSDFQGQVGALGEDQFGRDALLSDLLIFPPGTELHEHPLTLGGKVVLQDRVSILLSSRPEGGTWSSVVRDVR